MLSAWPAGLAVCLACRACCLQSEVPGLQGLLSAIRGAWRLLTCCLQQMRLFAACLLDTSCHQLLFAVLHFARRKLTSQPSSAAADVRNKRASQKQGKKITGMQYMPAHPNKLLITSNDSRIRLYDGEAAGLHGHQAGHANTELYHAAAAAMPCCSPQAAKCFIVAVYCRSCQRCQHLPLVL